MTSTDHFSKIEKELTEEEELYAESVTETYSVKRMLSRTLLVASAFPTIFISYIVYLFRTPLWYIVVFVILYFGVLLFFVESRFDFILDVVYRLKKYFENV